MDLMRGDVVLSTAGHDMGTLFCVSDVQGDFLLLVNGAARKLSAPKKKRKKHVQFVGRPSHAAFLRLRGGEMVGDKELRNALAVFRDEHKLLSREE